jgi:hypothetical protein
MWDGGGVQENYVPDNYCTATFVYVCMYLCEVLRGRKKEKESFYQVPFGPFVTDGFLFPL